MLANRVKQLTQLRQFVQRDRLNHQNLERYPPLYFMRKKLELQKEQRISLIHFQHLEERTSSMRSKELQSAANHPNSAERAKKQILNAKKGSNYARVQRRDIYLALKSSPKKKNINSARKAAERAAAPAEVTEARKLQDSAQHAAKRAAAPAEVTEARKLQNSAQHAAGKFHKPFGIWINKFEFFLIRTSGSWRPFHS